MTGYANKLNEPFSAGQIPQQGVSINYASGATASGASTDSALSTAEPQANGAPARGLKNSILDLEAWLPQRRTKTDAKTSVPTVCMISASPAAKSAPDLARPPLDSVASTSVQVDASKIVAPAIVNPDSDAPAMLGYDISATAASVTNSPQSDSISPSVTSQTAPAVLDCAESFLDIPPLECKTVIKKE